MESNNFTRRSGSVMAIANALNRSLLTELSLKYNGITDGDTLPNPSFCPVCQEKLFCVDVDVEPLERIRNVDGKNITVRCTGCEVT